MSNDAGDWECLSQEMSNGAWDWERLGQELSNDARDWERLSQEMSIMTLELVKKWVMTPETENA